MKIRHYPVTPHPPCSFATFGGFKKRRQTHKRLTQSFCILSPSLHANFCESSGLSHKRLLVTRDLTPLETTGKLKRNLLGQKSTLVPLCQFFRMHRTVFRRFAFRRLLYFVPILYILSIFYYTNQPSIHHDGTEHSQDAFAYQEWW